MERRGFLKMLAGVLALPFFPKGLLREDGKRKLIELGEYYIAGYRFYKGDSVGIKKGDRLSLIREPSNVHDERAIEVYKGGVKIGYIPKRYNPVIANIMDQGIDVIAVVEHVDASAPPWERVKIKVYQITG